MMVTNVKILSWDLIRLSGGYDVEFRWGLGGV